MYAGRKTLFFVFSKMHQKERQLDGSDEGYT
jgi:hypothetical protein